MKVAVSIPDRVFAEAEALMKRQKTSRREPYSRALHTFVGQHTLDQVTETMNAAVDAVGENPDPFTEETARRAIASWRSTRRG
jgi:metal-responsive CopG/Arc/MetJ family transcriptional regulator